MLISIKVECKPKVFRPYQIRIGGECEHIRFRDMLRWAQDSGYSDIGSTAVEFLKLLDVLD